MQATVKRSIAFTGVGLHSGQAATMAVRPAAPGSGVWFCRVDVTDADQMIPARWDAVVDTRMHTVIGNGEGVTVSTVEHVMAALAGMGVDNALIDIDGPEAPIMDGSAKPFVDAIAAAGLSMTDMPRRALRVLREVSVTRGDATATLSPAETQTLSFAIDFPDPAIGRQSVALALGGDRFARSLADCRTFTRLSEIKQLRALGLAKGGDLDNAVVVDGARVVNPEGFRRRDECVRHKALDAVGDLALAGGPIIGAYHGDRAGHAVTNALLRTLFATPGAWVWEPDASRDGARRDAAQRIAAE